MTKSGKWEIVKKYGGAVLPCAFFSDSIRQSLILIEQLFGVYAPVASECMSLPLVSFDRGFGLSALTPDRGLGAAVPLLSCCVVRRYYLLLLYYYYRRSY